MKRLKRFCNFLIFIIVLIGINFAYQVIHSINLLSEQRTVYYEYPTMEACEMYGLHMNINSSNNIWITKLILYTNHEPGTVGEILQDCILNGWDRGEIR